MRSTVRIAILREELEKLGYRHESLLIDGVEYTRFTSSDGLVWLYKDANGRLPLPYVSASAVLNDKIIAAKYAVDKGIRVPRTVSIVDEMRSVADYRRLLSVGQQVGIVVKPSDATLSRGVSANVMTDAQLVVAIQEARRHSRSVIAQERVEGDEFRFNYVGTNLKAVIHKQKARVVGDGHSSVRELIIDENRQRLSITGLRVRYPQLSLQQIQDKGGVGLDVVPAEGEVVRLSDSTMIEQGASFYEVGDEIHESYKEIAHTLASDFGGGYLAVDIIIHDHTKPASADNYAFLEFNDIPAPMFFYACRNKPELPVMRDLARYIDQVLHLAARA